MTRLRGGHGFAIGLVVGLLAVQVVAAVTVTPLSFAPVSGADFDVNNDTRLAYDGWDLLLDSSNEVVAVGVDLNNTDTADKTGVVSLRLRQKDGTVVASNSTTFFIQSGRTGRCSVTLPTSQPSTAFSFVALDVNVTTVASQQCEIQGGGGGGSNKAPQAKFKTSPNNPDVGDNVTFDGSQSKDNDGSIVAFEWQIEVENGSTITPTGTVVDYTYDQPGCYNVTLTVTDDAGATDTANETLGVNPQNGNTNC